MSQEEEPRPQRGENAAAEAGGACSVCGRSLRSSRERAARFCAYHLDVKPAHRVRA